MAVEVTDDTLNAKVFFRDGVDVHELQQKATFRVQLRLSGVAMPEVGF